MSYLCSYRSSGFFYSTLVPLCLIHNGSEEHITSGSPLCGLDADNRTYVANNKCCWYVPGSKLFFHWKYVIVIPRVYMDVTAEDMWMSDECKIKRWRQLERKYLHVWPDYCSCVLSYQNSVTNRLPCMWLPFCLVRLGEHPFTMKVGFS